MVKVDSFLLCYSRNKKFSHPKTMSNKVSLVYSVLTFATVGSSILAASFRNTNNIIDAVSLLRVKPSNTSHTQYALILFNSHIHCKLLHNIQKGKPIWNQRVDVEAFCEEYYGADELGMTAPVLVLLNAGPRLHAVDPWSETQIP